MDGALVGMLVAHALFVASGITYSAYWILQDAGSGRAAATLFCLSILLGFAAAFGIFACVLASSPLADGRRLGLRHIVAANAALLLAAYAVTSGLMGRVFTSELVFVVIWSTAESCAIRAALARGWLSGSGAAVAAALVSLALVVGLACYAIYFLLDGRARFYTGLVPYGAVALVMATIGALLWRTVSRARHSDRVA
jgi:hypothetical protein